jgi:ribonuclease E
MSQFGIIEMTRQRMRPSLKRSVYFDCPHCKGAGLVKTPESMSLDVMRKLAIAANDLRVQRVELSACPDVSFYLLNRKRAQLAAIEAETKKRILVRTDQELGLDEMRLDLYDARDGVVIVEDLGLDLTQPPHRSQLQTRPAGGQRPGNRQKPGGRFDGRRRDQPNRQPPPRGKQEPLHQDEFDLDEREDATEELHEQLAGERNNGEPLLEPQDHEATGEHGEQEGEHAGGDGGRRRRRRRRGRRGRGRNSEGGQNPQNPQPGPPQGRSGPNDRGVYESVGEDEVADDFEDEEPDHSEEPGPAPAPIGEAQIEEEHESEDDSIGNRREPEAPSADSDKPRRRRRRGGRGRRGRRTDAKDPISETPAAEADADANETEAVEAIEESAAAAASEAVEAVEEEVEAEDVEAEEAPKPKRRRGRRGGRGRTKKATANTTDESPKLSAKEAKELAKTGSTDAHIVDDEEIVDPEPPSQPQSYRDLDTINDDYDD